MLPAPPSLNIAFVFNSNGNVEWCSTCSSSSSDTEDDTYAYNMPHRRSLGGVRVSYVPNDRRLATKKRSGTPDAALNFPRKQNPRNPGNAAHFSVDFSAIGPPPARKQMMPRQMSQPIALAPTLEREREASASVAVPGFPSPMNVSLPASSADRDKNCVIS